MGLVCGLLVAFIAWLAKQIFSRRQLYLVQPKLFDYSGLGTTANAKTVELSVINSGRRVEEDIRVQFAPGFTYSVVASGVSGLAVIDGVLRIDRLAPKQEVTVILYVEGGEFRKDHISGLASRDTVGKIKATIQEAKNTPAQAVLGFIVFFFVLLPLGYAFGKMIEITIWPSVNPLFIASPKTVHFSEVDSGTSASYAFKDALKTRIIKGFVVESLERRGDYVYSTIKVDNTLDDKLTLMMTLESPVHDKRSEFAPSDYIVSSTFIYPGKSREFTIGDYMPSDVDPQEVYLEATIGYDNGTVWIKKDLKFNGQPK